MDFDTAFRELLESGCRFLLVGGVLRPFFAPGNTRPTFDVDVIVRSEDRERVIRFLYERGHALLLRFEQKPWADVEIETEPDVAQAVQRTASAKGASFYRAGPASSIDVWFDIGVPFDELSARAEPRTIRGRVLPAVCADDWRRLKQLAGREKDLEDLSAFAPPPGADRD